MKVLGAWGGLGGRGCSAGREGREEDYIMR